MFTISTQQSQVLASGKYTARLRAWVKDQSGTYRNLTTDFGGWDFLRTATFEQNIDDVPASFELDLKREAYGWSLAQLMQGSPANLNTYLTYGSGYGPLLDAGRQVKLEAAIIPHGEQPAAGDWFKLVEGYIDEVDSGQDWGVHLSCRDLSAAIQDSFIQDERVYGITLNLFSGASNTWTGPLIWQPNTAFPAGANVLPTTLNGSYYNTVAGGTSGSTEPVWPGSGSVGDNSITWVQNAADTYPGSGVAVEHVMQAMLNDAGLSGVTLSVPSSPSWLLLIFKQQRQSALEAVRALAQQIGWDLRYLFGAGAGSLTFYQPKRTSPSVQYTFAKGVVLGVKKLAINVQNIRNVIRLIYNDSGDLDASGYPKRKILQVSDSSSIARFGGIQRFMEISEDWTSKIDTVGEATTMATACLNDLSSPLADMEVEVPFFPFAEVGDYYKFSADGIHFDVDQSMGIVGVKHDYSPKNPRTTLVCRGKPSGGYALWAEMGTAPSWPKGGGLGGGGLHKAASMQGTEPPPTVTAAAIVSGVRINVAVSKLKESEWDGYEFHLSASNASPPSSSTLYNAGKGHSFEIHGLNPNTSYYYSIVPLRLGAGGRRQRGQPTAWVALTPATLAPLHIYPSTSWVDQPPNCDFGSFVLGAGSPPDRWSMTAGTWGTDAVADSSVILDGQYSVNIDANGTLQSDLFPIKPLTDFILEAGFRNDNGTTALQATVRWYTKAREFISASSWITSPGATNTWGRGAARFTPPTNAAFAALSVTANNGGSTRHLWVGFVRLNEIHTAEPFQALGLATNLAAGSNAPSYFRSIDGEVRFKGNVSINGAFAAGSNLLFSAMPVGLRPKDARQFIVTGYNGTTNIALWVQMLGTGQLQNLTAWSSGWQFNLDQIRYAAEQ